LRERVHPHLSPPSSRGRRGKRLYSLLNGEKTR